MPTSSMVSGGVTERVSRRRAAILVVGYRRLAPGDELDRVIGLRGVFAELVEPQAREYGGSIFKEAGDLALGEFSDALSAIRCAAGLRDAVASRNQTLAPERRLAIRIGINLGNIIAEGGDVFGDAVNIAARLESLADPGSICVSQAVYDEVTASLDLAFEDLGFKTLKNIQRPVRVWRIAGATNDWPEDVNPWHVISLDEFDNRRAIAVLPFANFSGDKEQEFFADGITGDIISRLAGWRAFPVIDRSSTFTYKGEKVDVKQVAKELGAFYVLEGSVRKSGHRVRVTAQLIRADTNHHIMAERYDRDLTDLFELQDEIAHTIAGAIEPEILKFERDRIADRPQRSEDAYEFYQRGMFYHYRHTKQDNIEAQASFRRALALDPQYAQAAAALAITLVAAAYLGWAADPERNYTEAFDLGHTAIALDNRYPNAHFALGLVCMWMPRPDQAIAEFQDAIKLNPSFAASYVLLGQMHLYCGQPELTITLANKGIRLSPSDPRLFIWVPALAGAHYQLRQYEQAVEVGRRAWALKRNWPAGLRYVIAGLSQLGRLDEAQALVPELKLLNPSLNFVERNLRRLFIDEGAVQHLLDGLRKAGFN